MESPDIFGMHCSVDYNMQTNKTGNIKFELSPSLSHKLFMSFFLCFVGVAKHYCFELEQ